MPGALFLMHPQWLLGTVTMDAGVASKVTAYLGLLAWGLPASLLYRTFYAFCNALGKPRVLMAIGHARAPAAEPEPEPEPDPEPDPEPEPVPAPAPRARQYRRRDLQAES